MQVGFSTYGPSSRAALWQRPSVSAAASPPGPSSPDTSSTAPPSRPDGDPSTASPAPGAPPDPSAPPTTPGAPPAQDEDPPPERWSRWVGHVGTALSKVPRVLMFIPDFLRFAIFDAVIPLIGITAIFGGAVGSVATGAAGLMEAYDGMKKKDSASVLSGLGEVARGGYLGSLTYNSYQSGQFTPGGMGVAFGVLHGGLNLSSGLLKMRRGIHTNNRQEKLVGMMEAGMGLCAAVTLGMKGPWTVPALVLNSVLASTRALYLHHDKIKEYGRVVKERGRETWEDFKDLFRDTPHDAKKTP